MHAPHTYYHSIKVPEPYSRPKVMSTDRDVSLLFAACSSSAFKDFSTNRKSEAFVVAYVRPEDDDTLGMLMCYNLVWGQYLLAYICMLISISINKCHGKLRRAFISNRCLQIFTSSVDVQFSVCNFYVTLDLTHLNMSQRNAERADLCFVLWPVYPPVLSIWMISNLLLSITLTELP